MRQLLTQILLLLTVFTVVGSGKKATVFHNNNQLLDTSGNPVHAGGGGFLKVDDTWYWVGEDDSGYTSGVKDPGSLVNMYKSKDLVNWDYVGDVINVYTKDVNGNQLLTYCQVQRPKLIYNKRTEKYILWVHWEEIISYGPSQIFTATSDNVEGPYVITEQGHHRPGAGYNYPAAMGDRVGQLVLDYNTAAIDENDSSHPYVPVSAPYPPTILQYSDPDPDDLDTPQYVSQEDGYGTAQIDNYWSYQLSGVHFNYTLKALAVNMTEWNATAYNTYKDDYDVDPASYIVRYPTKVRSNVTTTKFTIGNPGDQRQKLVEPVIGPTLDESTDSKYVLMNSGDAAFITVTTDNGTIYYTTDGSTPSVSDSGSSNSTTARYWAGTRITVNGTAGTTLTVKAIATKDGKTSKVATQQYKIASDASDVPIFNPIINYPSGTYRKSASAFGWQGTRIYCPSYNTVCYYTMDGLDPAPALPGENLGYGSRDMTVFIDPKTDEGYLVHASDNIYNRVWKLRSDYLDVVPEEEYDVFVNESHEAPALVRNGGADGDWVYLLTSTQSGWYPNQSQYKRARSLSEGFDLPRDSTGYRDGTASWSALQPMGDPSTWKSQPTYVLDIGTDAKPVYIYVGDRWDTVTNALELSRAVFMPMTIDDAGNSEAGNATSGSVNVTYSPDLKINVAKHRIDSPQWSLLSLNKSVKATRSVALTAEQKAAGTYNYSASVVNDGHAYDIQPYDTIEQFYKPVSVPFYWQVDLEEVYTLSWIGLSFLSVGGSDAANRYIVLGSTNGQTWTTLVDNTQNAQPGYMSHKLKGKQARYVRLHDISVWDVAHSKEADWEVGVYEVSVYGF